MMLAMSEGEAAVVINPSHLSAVLEGLAQDERGDLSNVQDA
jgi:hypothetical protein